VSRSDRLAKLENAFGRGGDADNCAPGAARRRSSIRPSSTPPGERPGSIKRLCCSLPPLPA
jgi:hypothetical protein